MHEQTQEGEDPPAFPPNLTLGCAGGCFGARCRFVGVGTRRLQDPRQSELPCCPLGEPCRGANTARRGTGRLWAGGAQRKGEKCVTFCDELCCCWTLHLIHDALGKGFLEKPFSAPYRRTMERDSFFSPHSFVTKWVSQKLNAQYCKSPSMQGSLPVMGMK